MSRPLDGSRIRYKDAIEQHRDPYIKVRVLVYFQGESERPHPFLFRTMSGRIIMQRKNHLSDTRLSITSFPCHLGDLQFQHRYFVI